MTLTRDEIEERKEQLRQEILERECILAALEVLHRHATAHRDCHPVDVGALLPALLARPGATSPARQVTFLESAPVAVPAPPLPERYVHPELKNFGNPHGINTTIVRWAIARLSGDYTLQDIHAVLSREGRPLQRPEISVVLTRLKKRGEIAQICRGNGRKPAVFRKPQCAGNEQTEAAA